MTGIYADTSNIVDDETIEAADVKLPIDALDTALAGVADNVNDLADTVDQLDGPIQTLQGDVVTLRNDVDDLINAGGDDIEDVINGDVAFKQLAFDATTVTVTISSGVITVDRSFVTVDTEGAAASDELETINGADGDYLMLRIADNSRIVTVKHGVGNIVTPTGRDIRLKTTNFILVLQRAGTTWSALFAPPAVEGATVSRNSDQSIPNDTATAIVFDTVIDDNDLMFDISNPTRLTINTSGVYLIGSNVLFAANSSGFREIALIANGTTTLGATRQRATTSAAAIMSLSATGILAQGDYVELIVTHTSGNNLTVNTQTFSPIFWSQRVG